MNFWNFFFLVFEKTIFLKKNQNYNRKTFSSIAREIRKRDLKFCYKNIKHS